MVKKFYKMHGAGNDYILFDCIKEGIGDASAVSKKLSPRRFGVGSDGVILLCPSLIADCRMEMYNADGTEGKMCGNGIRLLGKLFYDLGYTARKHVTVETKSGVRALTLFPDGKNKIRSVRVDMGKASFSPPSVPVLLDGESVIERSVETEAGQVEMTCVSMGNPHCVIFSNDWSGAEEIAPRLQKSKLFPEGVNVEFVRVGSPREIAMRVWERGCGETYSCGTGACAAVAAAVQNHYCQKDREVTVSLKGGTLSVRYSDSTVFLSGGAELVYEGRVRI